MNSLGFDEEKGILIASFSGVIHKEEVVNYINSFNSFKSCSNELTILQDFTNASYNIDINDLEELANVAKYNIAKFEMIRIANVHNKTDETAISLLFSNLILSGNLKYKTFNTKSAALKWLSEL